LILENLIKSCIKQNRQAQEELYNLYKGILFVLSLRYCQNEAEAEDNLHDAFIEIFVNIKNYKGTGSFEGWIKKIVIYKAINRFKQKIILTSIKDDYAQDTTIDDLETDLSLDYLLSIIQELPNQYRLVFNLFELDNYSHQEIAQMLSISEGTSKSNLFRAKLLLKEKINSKKTFHKLRSSNGK
jgi:RNA polymerase sigma-70 factor (ECF subfamily)